MRFLIIGAGSIGTRHGTLLREMGHRVRFIDTNPALNTHRLKDAGTYDGVLVCTPANVRLNDCGGNTYPLPTFVEKPMGKILRATNVQVGFCYYFDPSLRDFVSWFKDEQIYSVTITSGQDLETWHDEPYQERYHGTPGQGGVLLDSMSHSLFVARWLLGDLELVGAVTGRLSHLDIDTEDTAALLLKSDSGVPCYCLTDYLRDPREFRIEVVNGFATKTWEFNLDNLLVMYQAQMTAFVRLCRGDVSYARPSWNAGRAVDIILNQVWRRGFLPAGPPRHVALDEMSI